MPGNNVLPVKSSAIIQPTDQTSTIIKNKQSELKMYEKYSKDVLLKTKIKGEK